jgi:hypothetical protein
LNWLHRHSVGPVAQGLVGAGYGVGGAALGAGSAAVGGAAHALGYPETGTAWMDAAKNLGGSSWAGMKDIYGGARNLITGDTQSYVGDRIAQQAGYMRQSGNGGMADALNLGHGAGNYAAQAAVGAIGASSAFPGMVGRLKLPGLPANSPVMNALGRGGSGASPAGQAGNMFGAVGNAYGKVPGAARAVAGLGAMQGAGDVIGNAVSPPTAESSFNEAHHRLQEPAFQEAYTQALKSGDPNAATQMLTPYIQQMLPWAEQQNGGEKAPQIFERISKDGLTMDDIPAMFQKPDVQQVTQQLAKSGHPDPQKGAIDWVMSQPWDKQAAMLVGIPLALYGMISMATGNGGVLPFLMSILGAGAGAYGMGAMDGMLGGEQGQTSPDGIKPPVAPVQNQQSQPGRLDLLGRALGQQPDWNARRQLAAQQGESLPWQASLAEYTGLGEDAVRQGILAKYLEQARTQGLTEADALQLATNHGAWFPNQAG